MAKPDTEPEEMTPEQWRATRPRDPGERGKYAAREIGKEIRKALEDVEI